MSGRALGTVAAEVSRRPFFYEPMLVVIAALVPSVLARDAIADSFGSYGWIWLVGGVIVAWTFLRLVPLLRYVPPSTMRHPSRWLTVLPFAPMALGFGLAYIVVAFIVARIPALEFDPRAAGCVGGLVLGATLGANYWIATFGYAARRERAKRLRAAV